MSSSNAAHPARPDTIDARCDVDLSDLSESVARHVAKDSTLKQAAEWFANAINESKPAWYDDEWQILYEEYALGCFMFPHEGRKQPRVHKFARRVARGKMSLASEQLRARVYHWVLSCIFPEHSNIKHVFEQLEEHMTGESVEAPHMPEALSLVATNPFPISSSLDIELAAQKPDASQPRPHKPRKKRDRTPALENDNAKRQQTEHFDFTGDPPAEPPASPSTPGSPLSIADTDISGTSELERQLAGEDPQNQAELVYRRSVDELAGAEANVARLKAEVALNHIQYMKETQTKMDAVMNKLNGKN